MLSNLVGENKYFEVFLLALSLSVFVYAFAKQDELDRWKDAAKNAGSQSWKKWRKHRGITVIIRAISLLMIAPINLWNSTEQSE